MIHQLILSTIFACTSKTAESTKTAVPPTPPETVSTKAPSQESSEKETHLSPKPEQIGPIIDGTPITAPQEHKGSILVKHITTIQQSNQEISCTLLCQQSVMNSPITQGSYLIQDCSEDRVENWQELVQQGNPTVSVGEITCQLIPKPPPRVIKGRAPLCSTEEMHEVSDLASHFTRQAQEEAISIFSFAELHNILCAHEAPKQLQERCIQALREEQAHTRMAIALCEKYGGSAPTIRTPQQKTVSLFNAARHNALVGCIQETWAAVLEEYQAQHTQKHFRTQSRIAKDEASHAQLAWDIHDFFMSQLSKEEQALMIAQMNTFLSSQSIDIIKSFPGSQEIGIPSQEMQKQLYAEFSMLIQERIRQAA